MAELLERIWGSTGELQTRTVDMTIANLRQKIERDPSQPRILVTVTGFTDVSVFARTLTTALGLGLGIDYSLFIVSRYREELAEGREPEAALDRTLQTAGRTVLFSAGTVAVSLAALFVFPIVYLRSFAWAGIAVVALAAAAAVVALPAVLYLLGPRLDALSW